VVTENARVLSVVEALGVGDYAAVGGIFLESHESLRNDYEVSTPELDAAVRVAVEAGAIGARMTGAGFGGSAIALSGRDGAESLAHGQSRAFRELGFATPRIFPVETSAGACRIV
jgi:galactokinase